MHMHALLLLLPWLLRLLLQEGSGAAPPLGRVGGVKVVCASS
jgi:hypothetical protein